MARVRQESWNSGRWSILNHLGQPWTPLTWDTEEGAKRYLKDYRGLNPKMDLKRHKVVPVAVTITAII